MHNITPTEHHLILAGLRLLEQAVIRGDVPGDIAVIVTGNSNTMPTGGAINDLCETINFESYHCE